MEARSWRSAAGLSHRALAKRTVEGRRRCAGDEQFGQRAFREIDQRANLRGHRPGAPAEIEPGPDVTTRQAVCSAAGEGGNEP